MEEKTLVNVVKVVFTNEATNEKHEIKTGSEIDIEPIKSEGKRDVLRVKNTIYGVNQTEDIILGYKLKIKDSLFNIKTMQLIDGGYIVDGKYQGGKAGEKVNKQMITIDIYTEEKDYSRTIGYAKFTYKHCKGKPSKWKMKDGAFMVPEYEVESIPFRGEESVQIEFLPSTEDELSNITTDTTPNGGAVTTQNSDVILEVTSNIKWKFEEAINQDDVINKNFIVKKKESNEEVLGNLTIDSTKKIVTFVPISIEKGVTYLAEGHKVRKLSGNGETQFISVEFTTIA